MWNVMVVDDERPALEELSEFLVAEEQIAEVYRFQKPTEALAKFLKLSPDFVFLDIEMPGMSALELAWNIQELGTDAEIVFVTAYNQHALAAFELFALDYVLKPFNPHRIKQTLERFAKVTRIRNGQRSAVVEFDSYTQGRTENLSMGVNIFGPIAATGRYGNMVWNSSKSKELFVYLLLHPQIGLAQIIEDVFPDFTPDKAAYYVHTCLYRIRKSLNNCGIGREIKIEYQNIRYETKISEHVLIDYAYFMQAESAETRIERYKGDLLAEVEAEWTRPFQIACDDIYEAALHEAVRNAQSLGNLKMVEKYKSMLSQWNV